MDISRMVPPEDLDYAVPGVLCDAIHELMDALEHDDPLACENEDEVEGWCRSLPPELDLPTRHYYADGGWRCGPPPSAAELCPRALKQSR